MDKGRVDSFDIAIAGCGPAGLLLARDGHQALLMSGLAGNPLPRLGLERLDYTAQ